jgi:hypothetical protein
MTDTVTIKKLKILSARLNRLAPNINKGGCGVVASLIAPYISMYYPTIVRALDDSEIADLNQVRPRIKSTSLSAWNAKGVHFGHIMLELKVGDVSYWYDTISLSKHVPPKQLGDHVLLPHTGFLTYEEVRSISSRGGGWNKRFNRDHIPALKTCIQHFFTHSINKPLRELQSAEKVLRTK